MRGTVCSVLLSSLLFGSACVLDSQACGQRTCQGCCSSDGFCLRGTEPNACGSAGEACGVCQAPLVCGSGRCQGASGGGGGGGGGAAGGSPMAGGGATVDAGSGRAGTCQDTLKNGPETDVDCGGDCAARCAVYRGCRVQADCEARTTCERSFCLPGEWRTAPPIPAARANPASVVVGDGLYVLGGLDSSYGETSTVYRYSLTGQSWSTAASFPVPRQQASAAALPDGRLVLVGGTSDRDAGAPGARVDVYDPRTNTWSPGVPLPSPRAGACTVARPNGDLLVIGGFDGEDSNSKRSVALLRADAGAWVETQDVLLVPRSMAWCHALADGGVLLAGGITTGSSYCTRTVEVLNVETLTTTSRAQLSTSQAVGVGGLTRSGNGYFLGGWACSPTSRSGGPTATSWLYLPTSNEWGSAASVPVPLSGAASARLANGSFFVTAGFTTATVLLPEPVSGSYVFTPY